MVMRSLGSATRICLSRQQRHNDAHYSVAWAIVVAVAASLCGSCWEPVQAAGHAADTARRVMVCLWKSLNLARGVALATDA